MLFICNYFVPRLFLDGIEAFVAKKLAQLLEALRYVIAQRFARAKRRGRHKLRTACRQLQVCARVTQRHCHFELRDKGAIDRHRHACQCEGALNITSFWGCTGCERSFREAPHVHLLRVGAQDSSHNREVLVELRHQRVATQRAHMWVLVDALHPSQQFLLSRLQQAALLLRQFRCVVRLRRLLLRPNEALLSSNRLLLRRGIGCHRIIAACSAFRFLTLRLREICLRLRQLAGLFGRLGFRSDIVGSEACRLRALGRPTQSIARCTQLRSRVASMTVT